MTYSQWDQVASWAGSHGYDIGGATGGLGHYPVVNVNWYQCVKWCNARSEKEGLAPCYTVSGNVYRRGDSAAECNFVVRGYRLPTDAEWQYAARGGMQSHGCDGSGGNVINAVMRHGEKFKDGSHDVSPKAADELIMTDPRENVWEWCYDWYPGFEGSCRVLRGGSWQGSTGRCWVGLRGGGWPGGTCSGVGFRAILPPVRCGASSLASVHGGCDGVERRCQPATGNQAGGQGVLQVECRVEIRESVTPLGFD